MQKRRLITVYTAKFYNEDKNFIYESKGYLTIDSAIEYGHEVLLGPHGEGMVGVKYFSIEKYYKLED